MTSTTLIEKLEKYAKKHSFYDFNAKAITSTSKPSSIKSTFYKPKLTWKGKNFNNN